MSQEGWKLKARPIEPTPVLEGEDAENFLKALEAVPEPSAEHLAYLDHLAQRAKEMRSGPRPLRAYGSTTHE